MTETEKNKTVEPEVLLLYKGNANVLVITAHSQFYCFRQDVSVAVRNSLKQLVIVKLYNEYRWVGFFEDARPFDGFTATAIGFQQDPFTNVLV
jgi:hypothetical protein